MNTHLHYTEINVQQEVARRMIAITAELNELREVDGLHIAISASDLFYLEALGYVVDFSTGFVRRIDGQAPTVTVKETVVQ